MSKCELFARELLCGSAEELESAVMNLQPAQSAFFCNVHMLMLSRESLSLATAMDRATIVVPDGVPVAWLQGRLGSSNASVYRGYQAVEALCSAAAKAGQSVGFFGSTESVLAALVVRLSGSHSNLSVGFSYAPPMFSSFEIELDSNLVQEINASNLRYLFVGLGCPKQELWIDKYANELNCTLLGVGAAFDWLAGTTSKPPGWMEKSGLAWLYRLIQDPRRMWRRYFIYNTKFVFASANLLVRRRLSR